LATAASACADFLLTGSGDLLIYADAMPPLRPSIPDDEARLRWAARATVVVVVLVLAVCGGYAAWLVYGLLTGTLEWGN
jgi:hypothetical protein